MSTNFGSLGMISSETAKPTCAEGTDALLKLIEQWECSVRKRLICGEQTDDPMGKRLVEHGAVVLFNCASELREYLSSLSIPQ